MVFTSFNFLIFFPLLAIGYYITPLKLRWLFLLIASYVFYINIKPIYAVLVAGVTISTYIFTRLIDNSTIESHKKILMWINIILILLPLFFFKYFGEINHGIIELMEAANIRWPLPEISVFLPIGISFYTFMAIGYTVDVYNEEIESEKNIGYLALFISFFPLILSGPIERARNMLSQFHNPKMFNYSMVTIGLKMMLWGYFMKLVVADRIGIYVDSVYGSIEMHNGTSLLLASILYPFQVYADLGGYSLIAIGVASVMGIKVMQNFKRPFFATSMSEFWRRWHISLISWLTDYIYTPLSFSFRKYKVWGVVSALMLTFFISGIWHGAAWTFVVWGIMQGVFLSIEAISKKKRKDFEKKYHLNTKWWYITVSILITFVLFAASQVFGRATSINDAFEVFSKIINEHGKLYIGSISILAYGFIGLLMVLVKDFTEEYYPKSLLLFNNKRRSIRFLSYAFVILLILLIGVFDGGQFIYFQF